MAKHLLITISFLIITANSSFGQNKIVKYCKVVMIFSEKKNNVASLYFGKREEPFNFKDTSIITKMQIANTLTTDVDVLNYMDEIGWSLISINASGGYTSTENLFFKKEFDKSEFVKTNN